MGVRLALNQIKKGALKAIIPLVKDKVIQWTAKACGVIKMFAESVINKITSYLLT